MTVALVVLVGLGLLAAVAALLVTIGRLDGERAALTRSLRALGDLRPELAGLVDEAHALRRAATGRTAAP